MVMFSAFTKDIYREIVHTKGRFFGIMAIVALGVAFLTGLNATGRDMRLTGDTYFDAQRLMDIRVVGTYGLSQADIDTIAAVSGVESVFATYNMDAQVTNNNRTANIKIHAYNADAGINQPVLLSGALPQKSNEAVVESDFLRVMGYTVGDSFTLISGKETDIRNSLQTDTFIISGVVTSPYYVSLERGSCAVGDGQTDFYIMLPDENFLQPVYSEAFVLVDGAAAWLSYDDPYKTAVDEVINALEAAGDESWYVLDRDSNLGYASYGDDSDKIEAIGRVFPLIFFLVAALVSLTSMTRLVEERRTEIGTLKSLGYGNMKIITKYLIYAIVPTLTGGLAGGYLGMKLFPKLIIDAYNMLYAMPDPVTPIHMDYLVLGISMGVLCTCMAAVLACAGELRGMPAVLMRPKPPKSGKRTVLERIGFIWRVLNFTQKVTARNILRYKKRFLMTVIGITGCTALLMTGFGLKDSLSEILGKQFEDINLYNMIVSFSGSATESELDSANAVLLAANTSHQSLKAHQKTMEAGTADKRYQQITLITPDTMDDFALFFNLHHRTTREIYTPDSRGVVVTEKLARLLKVQIGDEVTIKDGNGFRFTVLVTGISEQYFMHYIYMSPDLYQTIYGKEAANNCLFAIVDTSADARDALAKALLKEPGVNGVSFVQSMINNFNDIIENLNFVVYVLIISAGALALIVLLNLTYINISERIRELATIEVLGFYDREVSAYVYRENAVLTVVGAVTGLLLGRLLHLFVILSAETDIMMFGRDIKPMSYIYSVVLTLFFSLLVNWITGFRLRRINMVEALKCVE